MACNGANVSLLLITYSHATRSPAHDTTHQKSLLIEGGSIDPFTGISYLITMEGPGDKIDHGIRNFNLPRNQVRKRGNISLNQSPKYIHHFPPTFTPMFILPSSTQ
jgi:hypothetical protein